MVRNTISPHVPNTDLTAGTEIGTNQAGFPFLFALCALAALVIWLGVDVKKGRRDAVKFALERRDSGVPSGCAVGERNKDGDLRYDGREEMTRKD